MIRIELKDIRTWYSNGGFVLCGHTLREYFEITKEDITLIISDKKTKNSYKCLLQESDFGCDVQFLDTAWQHSQYICQSTAQYIRKHMPELLSKTFYVSVEQ